jgi:hypothetical protein
MRFGDPQPHEVFSRALKLETAPQDRIVGALTAVAGDGLQLESPIDLDFEALLHSLPRHEGGSVLGIERIGDGRRYGPGQNRKIEGLRRSECCPGRGSMVGMPGDPALIEHQKRIHIRRRVHDVLGQLLDRLFVEPSIRVAEDNRSLYSQNSRCQVHLSSADRTEVAEHRPKGRSLSHGKAEQGEVRALSSKRCQHRAEAKGLIIGMGRYG